MTTIKIQVIDKVTVNGVDITEHVKWIATSPLRQRLRLWFFRWRVNRKKGAEA